MSKPRYRIEYLTHAEYMSWDSKKVPIKYLFIDGGLL